MAFNYANAQATASRLIAQFGAPRQVVLVRPGVPAGPDWDPIPGEDTRTSATCVILPASKSTIEAFDNRFEAGTLIDERLRFVIMAASGLPFVPKGADYLEFDGGRWFILGVTPLSPGGVDVLYKMGCQLNGAPA
jgi:hypothetical protein